MAIDNGIIARKKLASMSIEASSGPVDSISVKVNSEPGQRIGITPSLEIVYERKNTLHVLKINVETRINIPEKVSQLSVPGTHFDKEPRTHHIMTGQTAETTQFPVFLTGPILTPHYQPTHLHQNLSTEVSQDHNLPIVNTAKTKESKIRLN